MGVAGKQEYAGQQPRDESLLHKLMTARRKDTGQLMTNGEICAQSFTFILAGECSGQEHALFMWFMCGVRDKQQSFLHMYIL